MATDALATTDPVIDGEEGGQVLVLGRGQIHTLRTTDGAMVGHLLSAVP